MFGKLKNICTKINICLVDGNMFWKLIYLTLIPLHTGNPLKNSILNHLANFSKFLDRYSFHCIGDLNSEISETALTNICDVSITWKI